MSGADRLGRLQAAMRDRGAGICVIAGAANLRYLLGYDSMAIERLTVLIATPERAVMILPDFDVAEFEAESWRPPALGWPDRDGPAAAVVEAFRLLGDPSGPALVDDELPFRFFLQLRDRLGEAPGSTDDVLAPLLLRKDAEEIERIGRTAELISAGIDLGVAEAAPGMTELQLQRRIEAFLADGGSESLDYVLVQAGANAASPHHQPDRTPIRAGESVLFDIEVRLDGYYADIAQQVFLGEVPDEYRGHYDLVAAAQEAGVQAAVVGATADGVAAASFGPIEDAGLGAFFGPRTGHGLGVAVHEPPSVVVGNQMELVAGTVITVEPGIYLPDRWGIRIEDTVVITDDGPKRLTRGARPLTVRAV